MKQVLFIDTTLRDGEQTAGVRFSGKQKIHLAKQLDDLGVAIIEAGIPAMGKEEMAVIHQLCHLNLKAKILTWNRMVIDDIRKAYETGCKNAHITVPASDLHILEKLKMTKTEVINQMKRVVAFAVGKGLEVSIGAEDASRAQFDFLIQMYQEAIKEGAIRVRYADTVSRLDPFSSYDRVKKIKENITVPLDFHGHNDLGLATANALGAFRGGADFISCSINGLGERAGNTALEEVVVALELMSECKTGIQLNKMKGISKIVEKYSGRWVQQSKPIVGDMVFSHESGIHVDGILKNKQTYEFVSPELLGRKREIIIGKHSGTTAIIYWMKKKGKVITTNQAKKLLKKVRKSHRTFEVMD